jgi:hypothetical protein
MAWVHKTQPWIDPSHDVHISCRAGNNAQRYQGAATNNDQPFRIRLIGFEKGGKGNQCLLKCVGFNTAHVILR